MRSNNCDKTALLIFLLMVLFLPAQLAFAAPEEIKVDWSKIERV